MLADNCNLDELLSKPKHCFFRKEIMKNNIKEQFDNEISSNYKKHTTSKGLRKHLIDHFNCTLLSYINKICKDNVYSLLDIGCGEGFILKLIVEQQDKIALFGCDINELALLHAKTFVPSATFFQNDEYFTKLEDNSFDCIICTEVLEHIKEPEKMLKKIQEISRKYVILSVPHEPFFRLGNLLSGKYINTLGNHPEHLQHFGISKFRTICNKYFNEIDCKDVFPWIIYVGTIKC